MASKCIDVWLPVAASGTTDNSAIMACSRMHRQETTDWLKLCARHRVLEVMLKHWQEYTEFNLGEMPELVPVSDDDSDDDEMPALASSSSDDDLHYDDDFDSDDPDSDAGDAYDRMVRDAFDGMEFPENRGQFLETYLVRDRFRAYVSMKSIQP